ncbi:hypothetical protein HMPREF3226_01075 [Prevotella corporis]|uniref:Uncharacterized protein n=1 Tax=Prevotella corporis TaxID=28128 RepID=A0A133QBS7_9BACT|nr:hypothetical protein HMPREF3226_01075 [Prevotella corporis]
MTFFKTGSNILIINSLRTEIKRCHDGCFSPSAISLLMMIGDCLLLHEVIIR